MKYKMNNISIFLLFAISIIVICLIATFILKETGNMEASLRNFILIFLLASLMSYLFKHYILNFIKFIIFVTIGFAFIYLAYINIFLSIIFFTLYLIFFKKIINMPIFKSLKNIK